MYFVAAENVRRSEFFEESKAATTSFVEWTVVIITDEIESPGLSRPLPPGNCHILTGEARQNSSRADDLISFLSEPCVYGHVVMLVAAFGHSYESGWRKDYAGITHVESHSILDDPRLWKIIGSPNKNTLVAVYVLQA